MTVGGFWELVVDGCRRHGGSVVSGVRSRARNAAVGGHPRSRHLRGLAADVVMDAGRSAHMLLEWYYERGLHGYVRRGARSLHVQDRAARPPARRA